MTEDSMASISVLVTRPAHQNENLNKSLQTLGFEVISFPTIAINAAAATPFLSDLHNQIQGFDMALFVSRNAVDFTFKYLAPGSLPEKLQLGVIGKGSWLALKKKGVESHVIPAQSFNSEGLLAADALQQVAGKNIIIFRGQQGRNLLGDTLQQRGAKVTYCEVYRRKLPHYSNDYVVELLEQNFPGLAIFTSAEGLNNCFTLLDTNQAQQLRQVPWLLISERMRETATNLRHNAEIIIASNASDEGIVHALQQWQKNKGLNNHP